MRRAQEHYEVRLLRALVRESVFSLLETQGTKPTGATTPTGEPTKQNGDKPEEKKSFRKQALSKARSSLSGPAKASLKQAAKGPGMPADKITDTAAAFAEEMLSLQQDSSSEINPSQVRQKMRGLADSLGKGIEDMQKSQKDLDKMLTGPGKKE